MLTSPLPAYRPIPRFTQGYPRFGCGSDFGVLPEEKQEMKPIQDVKTRRKKHFKTSLKNFLLIPLFPIIGYFAFDAPGITDRITERSAPMSRIMGEGVGHIGACFSAHYLVNSLAHLYKGATAGKKKDEEEKSNS